MELSQWLIKYEVFADQIICDFMWSVQFIYLHGIATYTIMYGGLKMEKVLQ